MNEGYAMLGVTQERNGGKELSILDRFYIEEFKEMCSDWEFYMNRLLSKYDLYNEKAYIILSDESGVFLKGQIPLCDAKDIFLNNK